MVKFTKWSDPTFVPDLAQQARGLLEFSGAWALKNLVKNFVQIKILPRFPFEPIINSDDACWVARFQVHTDFTWNFSTRSSHAPSRNWTFWDLLHTNRLTVWPPYSYDTKYDIKYKLLFFLLKWFTRTIKIDDWLTWNVVNKSGSVNLKGAQFIGFYTVISFKEYPSFPHTRHFTVSIQHVTCTKRPLLLNPQNPSLRLITLTEIRDVWNCRSDGFVWN